MENTSSPEKLPFQLKPATLEDIPVLLALEQSVSGTNTYFPMLDEKEWGAEIKTSKVFLIESDSEIVGSISYQEKEPGHIYISGLVVDPRFQGKGIGRKALIELLEQFKNVGRIDLVTHPDNVSALGLYQSLGFVIESRVEDYFGDGEPRLLLTLI